jgi:hypothetical protein
MLHTKHLRQAFIAQKGFSTPSKDAMENVLTEKAVELIEAKVAEQLEEKKEEIAEVADKTEEAVEKVANEIGKKLEEPIAAIIDKLDDNPQIAKALDIVENVIEDQLDGREISCSCFGWLVALRISRKTQATPPSKPEEKLEKITINESSPSSQAKEESPPKAPES